MAKNEPLMYLPPPPSTRTLTERKLIQSMRWNLVLKVALVSFRTQVWTLRTMKKWVRTVRGTPAHPIQTRLTHSPDQTHLSHSPDWTRLTYLFAQLLAPLVSAPLMSALLAPSPCLHSPLAYTSCLTAGPAGLPAEPSDLWSLTLII
jgi:hypothetical protein